MFGWLAVEENVLVALEWRGGGGGLVGYLLALPTRRRRERDRRRQADEVLELCGLGDVRSQPAGKLPIGRARMVEMARAIVDEPRALLLDEPTWPAAAGAASGGRCSVSERSAGPPGRARPGSGR
jgi:branched-chain amino acid transport system ATP-binding protein